jgi:hypothetical protein
MLSLDPLFAIRKTLSDPKMALGQMKEMHGPVIAQTLTNTLISNFAEEFFSNLGLIYETINIKDPLLGIRLGQKYYIFILKVGIRPDLFIIFRGLSFHGSYKQVYLGAKIAESITPIAFSQSTSFKEGIKEIAFRQNAVLSKVLSPLYHQWTNIAQTSVSMITAWATEGTLQDCILKRPTLEKKDFLALKLLECMSKFHQSAVHKDLHWSNILVNREGGEITLLLNDVGLSATADEKKLLNVIGTSSVNLSPELIRRFAPLHGYFWQEAFYDEMSFDDWISSERYQVGNLLSLIYLGKTPHSLLVDLTRINDTYPKEKKNFDLLRKDFLDCYSLAESFLDDDERWDLEAEYKEAFQLYYDELPYFQGCVYKTSGHESALDLSRNYITYLEEEIEAAVYDGFFEEMYADWDRRLILESYLKEKVKESTDRFYLKAFERMKVSYIEDLKAALAETIALVTEPLEEALPHFAALEEGRMEAILPLFDQNPAKRPDFETIRQALLKKIHKMKA